jgi:hypothetical protein
MTTELERAAQVDADIKAADARRKADAEEAAMAGEKLDTILKHLDSLGKRMDAFEKKPGEEDDSDDERTAKSYPPSDMNPPEQGRRSRCGPPARRGFACRFDSRRRGGD